MSINEAQAAAASECNRQAAALMVQCVTDLEASHCRIPVAVNGANYVVTVTKLEAPINEEDVYNG